MLKGHGTAFNFSMGANLMRKWKHAVIAALAVFGGGGTVWAQSQSPGASFGPDVYRLGKGVLFTLHQRLTEDQPDHLVSAYLGACDGSWVSKPIKFEVNLEDGDNLQAQQKRLLERLQSPIDGPIAIEEWSVAPGSRLGAQRDPIIKMCKSARTIPKNLLVPVASTEVVAYSVVSSTVARKGNLIDLWTVMSDFREEPIVVNGKPFLQDGKEVLHSVFTGAKTMRRESVNCANRAAAVSTAVIYEGGGKVPETINIPRNKMEFSEPVPNSIGETMVDFLCKVF